MALRERGLSRVWWARRRRPRARPCTAVTWPQDGACPCVLLTGGECGARATARRPGLILEALTPYVRKCHGARGAGNRLRRNHLGFSYIGCTETGVNSGKNLP